MTHRLHRGSLRGAKVLPTQTPCKAFLQTNPSCSWTNDISFQLIFSIKHCSSGVVLVRSGWPHPRLLCKSWMPDHLDPWINSHRTDQPRCHCPGLTHCLPCSHVAHRLDCLPGPQPWGWGSGWGVKGVGVARESQCQSASSRTGTVPP